MSGRKLSKTTIELQEQLRRSKEESLLRYRALRAKLEDKLIFVARRGNQAAYLYDVESPAGACVLLVVNERMNRDECEPPALHPWVGRVDDWYARWSKWLRPAHTTIKDRHLYADEENEQALCFRAVEVLRTLPHAISDAVSVDRQERCTLGGQPDDTCAHCEGLAHRHGECDCQQQQDRRS